MEQDTIVVGDLHGKVEIVEWAISTGKRIIFIGDYLDSFDRSVKDQVLTLTTILDLIEKDPEKYIGLIGNHELSYLDKNMRASGFNAETYVHVFPIQSRMKKLLRSFIYSHGYLISHAGISKEFLDIYQISYDEYLDSGSYNQIGYARGGLNQIGGIYWCDWFHEFEPIPDLPQIVGHSGYRPPGEHLGIICKGNSFNIDCLDHSREVLLLKEGETQVIKISN